MKQLMNKAIIIGGDHHNTLAVIRSLGRKKIPTTIIVHDNVKKRKELMISHSKFCNEIIITENNIESIKNILLKIKNVNKKGIIIPCSDLAEYAIDFFFEDFCKYYYIPGFKKMPQKVISLMDKYKQKQWAEANNILMAKSWKIDLSQSINKNKIIYPCIIKPNISAFGEKTDIKICMNKEILKKELENFKKKKYQEVIIQQFLTKEYEICALGCMTENKIYGSWIRKIRENPPQGGGSLTFAKYEENEKIEKQINDVLKKIQQEGYRGLYDVEFFQCKEGLFLNEINFRHSGNGYSLIKNGINAPYLYYMSCLKTTFKGKNELKNKNMYFIDELNELSLFKNGYIKIVDVIKDFFKASSYAKLSFDDIKITIWFLITTIKKIVKRRA